MPQQKKKGAHEKKVSHAKQAHGGALTAKKVTLGGLRGGAGSSTLAPTRPVSEDVKVLYQQLTGTIHQWEMELLETLFNPMHPYPLPGICPTGHFSHQNSWFTAGYSVESAYGVYPSVNQDTGPNITGADGSSSVGANVQMTGVGTAAAVAAMLTDAYHGARYDQREGLVRGTFSVIESGSYIILFDPACTNNPVLLVSMKDTEDWWTDTDNISQVPMFGGGVAREQFGWDRDPYRAYNGYNVPVAPDYEATVDTSLWQYTGGAALHLAVQAKTAYSDVAIKARNLVDYDRRFFDAPSEGGEYGDPTQPEKANEAIAVYNASMWRRPYTVNPTGGNWKTTEASLMAFAVQRGLPLLEVHVVNAASGGAPVNFNFEARAWLGVSYNTLKDNATTAFHTVPCVVPPWFASCRTRGGVSMARSKLGEELITNTVRSLARSPLPVVPARIMNSVSAKKAGPSFLSTIMSGIANAAGIDVKNPLPSIGSLLVKRVLPALGGVLGL